MSEPFHVTRYKGAIDILARTIWVAARDESVRGQEAVACVVMNRLIGCHRNRECEWGNGIGEVCKRLRQFDCGNTEIIRALPPTNNPAKEPVLEQCMRIARRAVAGTLRDCTNRATHFHADHVAPRWASGHVPSAWIGNFLFYNDIPQH